MGTLGTAVQEHLRVWGWYLEGCLEHAAGSADMGTLGTVVEEDFSFSDYDLEEAPSATLDPASRRCHQALGSCSAAAPGASPAMTCFSWKRLHPSAAGSPQHTAGWPLPQSRHLLHHE